MTDPRWCVVQTLPHAESKAAQHLERQGYRTYLDLFGRKVRRVIDDLSVAAA